MITGRTLLGSLLTACLSLLAVTVGALSARGLDDTSATAGVAGQVGDAAVQSEGATAPQEHAATAPYKPKSKAELRRTLTALQYRVTQEEATEPAFANRYWNNKKQGLYHCIVCDLPLFPSITQFKSGTGWPSFYAPLAADRIGTKRDWKMVFPRLEVHCNRCGSHLGHVFNDGPPPTGKRFCLNSASLRFVEQGEESSEESSEPSPVRPAQPTAPDQTASTLRPAAAH